MARSERSQAPPRGEPRRWAYDPVMRSLSDRRVATFFALVLASGLCLGLLVFRDTHNGAYGYRFLAWNLFLAWIPFLLALALYDSARQRRPRVVLVLLGVLWLLFLPNAPYIVTDFVHVGEVPGAPLWYDAGMTAAFAGTGLVLGLGSLLLVQGVVARRFGALSGWLMVLPVLLLCSVGISIGRFQRLNSWDALTRPDALVRGGVADGDFHGGEAGASVVAGSAGDRAAAATPAAAVIEGCGRERDRCRRRRRVYRPGIARDLRGDAVCVGRLHAEGVRSVTERPEGGAAAATGEADSVVDPALEGREARLGEAEGG